MISTRKSTVFFSLRIKACKPFLQEFPGIDFLEIGPQFRAFEFAVFERIGFRVILDEKVERIVGSHVGDDFDLDFQLSGFFRKDQPRQVIAESVLLPS